MVFMILRQGGEGLATSLGKRFSHTLDVWVPPAAQASAEERRRGRFAVGMAMALTPVMAVLSVTQLAWGNPQGGLGSAAIGLVLALAPALYRRWGRLEPIVHGVLGFGWLALCYIAISSRGAGINAASVGLAELPLFAVLLTGMRGGAVWAAIACATEIGLALLGGAGQLVERVPPPQRMFVEYSSLLIITLTLFAVGVMYELWRKQALLEVTQQEDAIRAAERKQVQAETEARLAQAEKLASIGRVTAAVAHEINNPLSYLGMNLRFLRDQLGDTAQDRDEMERAVDDGIDGVSRIAHLVARLGAYARGDGSGADGEATDVAGALDRAIRLAQPHTRGRAEVRCEVGSVPPARGQEQALVQVFVNLIVNAAQALPDDRVAGNRIDLSVATTGDWVAVEVRDNGCGIAGDILPRLGEPFFTTKPIGQGTGLGLAVSKATLRALGGRLEFESVPGNTVARVLLPVGEGRPAAAPPARAVRVAADIPALRILIVDDDERVARSLQRVLAAHDVAAVATGAAALELLARRGDFDLILCDLMMPGMTGMDLHRAVAEAHPALAPRMVFITGGAITENARAFCERHADRVVGKPVSADELTRILRAAAASGDAGRPPTRA
jgi:signal transduction histidine kinase/ActR/RegA family two-component response regulator